MPPAFLKSPLYSLSHKVDMVSRNDDKTLPPSFVSSALSHFNWLCFGWYRDWNIIYIIQTNTNHHNHRHKSNGDNSHDDIVLWAVIWPNGGEDSSLSWGVWIYIVMIHREWSPTKMSHLYKHHQLSKSSLAFNSYTLTTIFRLCHQDNIIVTVVTIRIVTMFGIFCVRLGM